MPPSELARHDIARLELAHAGVTAAPELARHDLASFELAGIGLSTPAPINIALAASVPVVSAIDAAHGVTAYGIASVPVVAVIDAVHGVAVTGIATVPLTADLAAVHGVAVSATAVIGVVALQDTVHGVALDSIASVALAAAANITVERYELRGEVRLGGVLVNRRVRAYLRSSGALLGEADTAVGRFRVHAGFAPAECYVTPIDMTEGATDWLPPTANRIASVLAMDTA